MDRLTKRVGVGEAVNIGDFDICKPFIKSGDCKTGMQGGFLGHWERHCNDTCPLGKMIDRLADYEDTGLTPEQVKDMAENVETSLLTWFEARYGFPVGELMNLCEAKQKGLLRVLPCKVGDMVYRFQRYFNDATLQSEVKIKPCRVESVSIESLFTTDHVFLHFVDFGKTVFLTREEAEAALKGADHE